jgi:hypothetical protein
VSRPRSETPPPYDPELPLHLRTEALVAQFDAETKDYAFDDGGHGTAYAEWFADLLEEWMAL